MNKVVENTLSNLNADVNKDLKKNIISSYFYTENIFEFNIKNKYLNVSIHFINHIGDKNQNMSLQDIWPSFENLLGYKIKKIIFFEYR
jgi:hypothetical protein